jgi:hypothetical protein
MITENKQTLEDSLTFLEPGDLVRIAYKPLVDLGALGSKYSIGEYLGNDASKKVVKFDRTFFVIKSVTMTAQIEIPYDAIKSIDKLEPIKVF